MTTIPHIGGGGNNNKKNGRVIAEPTLQAHETRLTNRTFVLQRSQRTEEENEMTKHSVSKIYIVHILGEINLVKYTSSHSNHLLQSINWLKKAVKYIKT